MKADIFRMFDEAAKAANDLCRQQHETIGEIVELLVRTFDAGRKVLIFGNGGSAADAQHLAAEFVNRFRRKRKPFPALALTTDSSVLTSIANDSDFSEVFARQVEALGRVDDVALAISTSGGSPNVLKGVQTARRVGMICVAFSGSDGGELVKESDFSIVAPSAETPRIQECHILVGHVICELVERKLAGRGHHD